jgi:hypothetical protein
MQGKPVHTLDPRKPYKLLGVWFTMDLSWHKQKQDIKQTLQLMGAHLGRSYNSQTQKLRTMQTCLKAKARYAFPMMCYTAQDIEQLDRIMDRVVRKAYKLPPGTPTACIREELTKGGLGNTSLAVAYTTTALKNLTQAYAEEGKRGMLTKALLHAQHTAFTHPSAESQPGWLPTYSLRLRQLLQGLKADIQMWQEGGPKFPIPESSPAYDYPGEPRPHLRLPPLIPISKPLRVLYGIGITSIGQLLNRKGNRVLSPGNSS